MADFFGVKLRYNVPGGVGAPSRWAPAWLAKGALVMADMQGSRLTCDGRHFNSGERVRLHEERLAVDNGWQNGRVGFSLGIRLLLVGKNGGHASDYASQIGLFDIEKPLGGMLQAYDVAPPFAQLVIERVSWVLVHLPGSGFPDNKSRGLMVEANARSLLEREVFGRENFASFSRVFGLLPTVTDCRVSHLSLMGNRLGEIAAVNVTGETFCGDNPGQSFTRQLTPEMIEGLAN